ncbi:bleomycin resistance protein [Kribbella solani]|uniref:VOC family protein n=1 Tax=Kribbella solani TaxID=236067 RepID=UPI0029B28DBF|nr:VOC family protein [Kribbella solani]MDX2974237.1 bleomycin resistance protein [Kribbella solani]MDX3004369.1 bleomycin resistance protein [Kribbella solani]
MTEPSARASVQVAVDPATAFQVFTEEIDLWWLRNPINFFDSGRVTAMRIEPGVGGRVLEVYSGDDALELATITDWEPGTRLGYRSSVDDTSTRVDFEAVDGGTRVTVVQSLLVDDGRAFYFWPRVLRWLPGWVDRRGTADNQRRELDRLSLGLYYDDPVAAARWLHEVFGIGSWDTLPAEGTSPPWIELHAGSVAILLFKRTEPRPTAVDHNIWVYVDDVHAHFAHAQRSGAKIHSEIHTHGYTCYETEDLEGHPWTFAQARPTMT